MALPDRDRSERDGDGVVHPHPPAGSGAGDPVAALEAAGRRLVVVTAGGGAEAIARLATTPGGSGVLLEATVASARHAVDGLLGGSQESYCSGRTARRLAVACWQRAQRLGGSPAAGDVSCGGSPAAGDVPCGGSPAAGDVSCGGSPAAAVGLAVTAALVTRTPKRGPHRIHVAVQTLAETLVASLGLEKGGRSRAEEERMAAEVALAALMAVVRPVSADGGSGDLEVAPGLLRSDETLVTERVTAAPHVRQLFAGDRRVVSAGTEADVDDPVSGGLIFPGSFDPLHEGHRLMARVAEEIAERPVAYELSITNVDKPMLDYVEIRDRAAQFGPVASGPPAPEAAPTASCADRRLWLTRAATFLEKTTIFPKSTFIMGADTFARLADPRYYGGSRTKARDAARTIARRTRGLIVFGRARDGVFQDPASLEVPRELREVAYFVSEREFRLDMSSTQLRRTTADA